MPYAGHGILGHMSFFEKEVFDKMSAYKNKRSDVQGGEDMEQTELIKLSMQTLPEKLRHSAQPVWFRKNEIVIRKSEPTTNAYLMVSGDLLVQTEFEDGNYYGFAHILPGRYISDLEILSGRLINAVTLVAIEDSMALRFPLDVFMECLDQDIEFLRVITYGLADAMFDTSYGRGQNQYADSRKKVMRYLLRYMQNHGNGADVLTIRTTRQSIAAEIGVNVKTVNRAVKRLQEQALIHIEHGKIVLTTRQLEQLAQAMEESQEAAAF